MKFDPRSRRGVAVGVVASVLAVALVTGVIFLVKPYVPVLSLGVLYVFAVLPVAVVWGLWLALPVSVASMLAFNWFFLPPVHSFTLSQSENWFALAVYLATAVVVSELAARTRRRAASAEQRERESALLADLATELLAGAQLDDELDEVASRAAHGARRPTAHRSSSARRAGRRRALRRIRSRRRIVPSAPSTSRRAPTRTSPHAIASCLRLPRCSPSPSSATGWSGRRSRRRLCAAAISSRRRCCERSRTTSARR